MLRRSIVTAFVLACASPVHAQTFTWDAGAGNADGNWSTPANWAGDVVPPSGSTLVFPDISGARLAVQNDLSGFVVHGLTLDGGWQLSGNPFSSSGNINMSGLVARQRIGNDITLTTSQTWSTTGANGFDINGAVDLGANTLTLSALSGASFGLNAVSGSGGITKAGAGTWFVNNATTYTGVTQLNAGTTVLTNAQGFGSTAGATIVGNGAFLQIRNIAVGNEPLVLNGRGFDTGGNVFTGALSATGTASHSGSITLATTTAIRMDGTSDSLTLSGAIGDSGGAPTLQKIGSGKLTLAGSNTYTGITQVIEGTLRITNAQGLGSTAGRTEVQGILASPTLELSNVAIGAEPLLLGGTSLTSPGAQLSGLGTSSYAGDITLGRSASIGSSGTLTLSGVIGETGGSQALSVSGIGTVVLTNANTYTGTTGIGFGALEVRNPQALGSTAAGTFVSGRLVINNVALNNEPITLSGGSLVGVGTASAAGTITLSANSTLTVPDTLTLTGAITESGGARGITKNGVGIAILQGPSSYTGPTNIANGTLRVGSTANVIPDLSAVSVATGGTLDLNGFDEAIGNLSGAGSVLLNGGRLTVGGNTASADFSGAISGTGGLIKLGAGTQTLSGANTYAGGTAVQAGTLLVNNTSGSGTGVGTVSVLSGARLGGSGIIGGATTVRTGGTLAPGNSPGLLSFASGLTTLADAALEFEIGGTTPISEYDRIDVTGLAQLAAGTDIRIVPFDLGGGLYTFAGGGEFDLLIADDIRATIAGLNFFLPAHGSDLSFVFSIAPLGTRDVLHLSVVQQVPEPETYAMLAAGLALLAFSARRRKTLAYNL